MLKHTSGEKLNKLLYALQNVLLKTKKRTYLASTVHIKIIASRLLVTFEP